MQSLTACLASESALASRSFEIVPNILKYRGMGLLGILRKASILMNIVTDVNSGRLLQEIQLANNTSVMKSFTHLFTIHIWVQDL